MKSAKTVARAIKELLRIVEQLRDEYTHLGKTFSLDGRLVGDIGEVLAAEEYDIQLLDKLTKGYDGVTSNGQKVEIKSTMKKALNFPVRLAPVLYLGIEIHPDGSISEVFNGPGSVLKKALEHLVKPKNNFYVVSTGVLRRLNETVPEKNRVKKRRKT